MSTWLMAVRFLNMLLAFVSLAFLVGSLTHGWEAATRRERHIGLGHAGVLLVIAYGSGEALKTDVPPGSRVVMMVVALAYLLGGLMMRNDRNPDGSPTERKVGWWHVR